MFKIPAYQAIKAVHRSKRYMESIIHARALQCFFFYICLSKAPPLCRICNLAILSISPPG
jgi:hypothetical protein